MDKRFELNFTIEEGGIIQALHVHSVVLPDGSRYDAVNGWTKLPSEAKQKEERYHKGAIYRHVSGERYILAEVEAYKFCLISLTGGNRWRGPVHIPDAERAGPFQAGKYLNKEQFKLITGESERFTEES